jgi:hypothetical protein
MPQTGDAGAPPRRSPRHRAVGGHAVLEEVLREVPEREHPAVQETLQRLLAGAERVMARRRG